MHTQLTIFKKGLTLIAIPLLVQVVFIAVLMKARVDRDRAQYWAIHTKEVIAKVEETHRNLIEANLQVRGLVLSDRPATADLYRQVMRQVPRQLEELRALVLDNERQQPQIHQLGDRSREFLGWIRDEEDLIRSGRRDRALERIDRGTDLLKAIRSTIDDVLREEERLDRERMETLRASSVQQAWTLIGGGAAIVVSTLILALLFLQGIVQRLAVLRDNARRFGEGRPLNEPLSGRDEITEVDRAFHEMADNLSQQKQENEMFVYSVSHDLRSPLVNLQGFSEELNVSYRDLESLFRREEVPAGIRERGLRLMASDIEESIRFIQTAVGRLARIIDALLRLSRAGRVEYQWQSVDVASTVRKIVEALQDSISGKGAEVVVDDLPPSWGDPTALEQIFANLIGNAVQYLDPARPGRIKIGVTDLDGPGNPAGLRVYYVEDNGLGIPPAYHQRMFTAFNRLHADAAQGEGIGLALVRRMVERHGGRIWLESAAGVGTTFFVALPSSPRDGSAGAEGSRPRFTNFEESIPNGR
ncbi:MAG: sensor histidine kinase [Isosphaeraceae bacterium]